MLEKAIFWAKFIETAYSMNSKTTNKRQSINFPKGWKLIKNINSIASFGPFRDKEFIGFVAQSSIEPNRYAIIFRGSETLLDFADDFEFSLVDFELIPNEGKVEYGFKTYYESLTFTNPKDGSSMTLNEYVETLPKDASFVIAGHSLGGSLATLHSFVLAKKGFSVETYTFASPMVGDQSFIKAYNSLIPNSYRIVNKPDVVPHLPGTLLGYEHVNTLFEVNSLEYAELEHSITAFHSLSTYIYCLGHDKNLKQII